MHDAYGDGGGPYSLYINGILEYSSPGNYGLGETVQIGIGCVPPTGACCVDEVCVATNTQDECDVLGGLWYMGQTCPDFQCPIMPANCDDPTLVYSNGNQAPVIMQYNVAQCDVVYPFQFSTADDFVLAGTDSVDIGAVVTWSWHWNGAATPGNYEAIKVVIYENDNISYPGTDMPAGEPVDAGPNCLHIANIPNGIVYETTVAPGGYYYIADGLTAYRIEIPVDVRLLGGVTYWLEIQPQMQFGLSGQSGLMNSDTQTGEYCMRFAVLFGYDPWATQADSVDVAFCLLGPAGGDCCEYIPGDVNGSDSYNGLDITYGVAFFKGGADPLCPGCTVDNCGAWNYCGDVNGSNSYNGLDITYGVAFFKGGPGPIFPPDCPPCVGVSGGFGAPEAPSVIKTKPVYEQMPNLK
jgi:hypothetical protein